MRGRHHAGHHLVERLEERPVDEDLTRGPNRVEAGTPLLAAERLELGDRGRLAEVVAEHRDVDVLREAVDQAERLRERRAALEQQTRQPWAEPLNRTSSIQQTQKSFSTFCDGGAQTTSGREEQFPAFVVRRRDHLAKRHIHHGWTGADGGLLEAPATDEAWAGEEPVVGARIVVSTQQLTQRAPASMQGSVGQARAEVIAKCRP